MIPTARALRASSSGRSAGGSADRRASSGRVFGADPVRAIVASSMKFAARGAPPLTHSARDRSSIALHGRVTPVARGLTLTASASSFLRTASANSSATHISHFHLNFRIIASLLHCAGQQATASAGRSVRLLRHSRAPDPDVNSSRPALSLIYNSDRQARLYRVAAGPMAHFDRCTLATASSGYPTRSSLRSADSIRGTYALSRRQRRRPRIGLH
jgi:hypothetical protein